MNERVRKTFKLTLANLPATRANLPATRDLRKTDYLDLNTTYLKVENVFRLSVRRENIFLSLRF